MESVSWPMLTLFLSFLVYIGYTFYRLGRTEQQVITTTRDIADTKLATATLAAAQSIAATGLGERVSRLEALIEKKNG